MDSAGSAVRVGSPDGLRYRSDRSPEALHDRDRGRDDRLPAAIGRDATLELVFERRGGRTIVAHAYAEPPYRIGQSFAIDDAAYIIIVCAGPGVFAGDRLHQSIRVERGARVVLTSQSALQVHPSIPQLRPKPDATVDGVSEAIVRHDYTVDDDAELHCHWDPVIPFTDAALIQEFDLHLAPNARLYWSDALMSGRVSRGEAWRFRELAHRLRLRIAGVLTYLERYRLSRDDGSLRRRWVADAANYFATTLVHHPRATADESEALQRRLDTMTRARAAIDLLQPQLMIGRVMASEGPAFAATRAAIRAALLDTVFQKPALAGRK